MAEPCLCGSLDCPRCGPLQGATKCRAHGRYTCPHCEDDELDFEPDDHPEPPDPDDEPVCDRFFDPY